MILLDTNVVSEVQRPQGNARVRALVSDHQADVRLSVITMGEVRAGIARLPASRRRSELEAWYGDVLRFQPAILPVTLEIAECWGAMRARFGQAGRALPVADGLIAATAIVHGLTLWTRNSRDFDDTGAAMRNPWEA